jgi:hypothetical protein
MNRREAANRERARVPGNRRSLDAGTLRVVRRVVDELMD